MKKADNNINDDEDGTSAASPRHECLAALLDYDSTSPMKQNSSLQRDVSLSPFKDGYRNLMGLKIAEVVWQAMRQESIGSAKQSKTKTKISFSTKDSEILMCAVCVDCTND